MHVHILSGAGAVPEEALVHSGRNVLFFSGEQKHCVWGQFGFGVMGAQFPLSGALLTLFPQHVISQAPEIGALQDMGAATTAAVIYGLFVVLVKVWQKLCKPGE